LLARFVHDRDQEAFTALVRRHGPLVWRVCRRLLAQPDRAEDAFQATFLVLARKAGTIQKPASLASWLHGVAFRISREARQRPRSQGADLEKIPAAAADPGQEAAWRELGRILEEEVHALPETLRMPVLLCYWEGKTNEQVGRQLGWPSGTVKTRLARARAVLHERLLRRGITLPAGAVVLLLAPAGVEGALPPALATGGASAAAVLGSDGVSAEVVALAEAILRGLSPNAMKLTLVVGLILGLTGLSAVGQRLSAVGSWPDEPAPAIADGRPSAVDRHGDALPPHALTRLGTMRLRHGNDAFCVAFAPSGRLLAASSCDRVVRLWEIPTGRLVREFRPEKPGSHILQVAFSPDGKFLAVGTEPEILLVEPGTGKIVRRWDEPRQVWSMTFSPDGETLAWGTGDSKVRLATIAGKEVLDWISPHQRVFGLAFSPDGKQLASGGWEDKRIVLWNAATGKQLWQFGDQKSGICFVRFTPDGRTLASGGEDKLIHFWDVATGAEKGRLPGHNAFVERAVFTSDGKRLVSASYDQTVRLWDIAAGKEICTLGQHEGLVYGLALSPDGKIAASGGGDHRIRLWDITKGKEIRPSSEPDLVSGSAAFAADGNSLLCLDASGAVHRWDPLTGKELGRLGIFAGPKLNTPAVFSPDGRKLARSTSDHTIDLWDVASGRRQVTLKGHRGLVHALEFSGDGRMLASAADGENVRLWDITTAKEKQRLNPLKNVQASLALSADGTLLAVAGLHRLLSGASSLQLWDTATGKELGLEDVSEGAWILAFSFDGRSLATAPPLQANQAACCTVWEMASRRTCLRLPFSSQITALAFSPDCRLLASGDNDGAIQLWGIGLNQKHRPLLGHAGPVRRLIFSPDGRLLASGGSDTTVLIWDVGSPEKNQTEPLGAEALTALWKELASPDPMVAHQAIWRLAASPEQVVPFLRERLHPGPVPDTRGIDRMIADLDSDVFDVRRRAAEELKRLGESATPALRRVLQGSPSVEVRGQVRRLLDNLDRPTPERLRGARALEVLEHAGGVDARRLLAGLARGAPDSWLTQQASATLERLSRRGAAGP
jgi:RNA polymerase sigma factor (sigma-70 family)